MHLTATLFQHLPEDALSRPSRPAHRFSLIPMSLLLALDGFWDKMSFSLLVPIGNQHEQDKTCVQVLSERVSTLNTKLLAPISVWRAADNVNNHHSTLSEN